ncbi:MAG: dihydrolipoyl dehydrogenase [bacterium]|nr:dihydrolipoyl dehydrogenase [bacterium]
MDYDLIIIGSGPGGYVSAIRAGQTGLKTALIEKSHIGGMCLNWGCIRTKALLERAKRLEAVKNAAVFGVDGIDPKKLSFNWPKAVKRSGRIVKRLTKGVEFLLKKNGVKVIKGSAVINADKSVSVENRNLTAKNIIIATGSRSGAVPRVIPKEMVVEVDRLLGLESLPEKIVILGGGPHAVELAQFFGMAGKTVTLLAEGPMLIPNTDPFLSAYAYKNLKKFKIDVLVSAEINGFENGEILVEYEDEETKRIPCDRVINAFDRRAVLPEMTMKPELVKGFVRVNDNLKTSVDGIYAVGDVNGRSIFAHAASAQGLHAVNVICGVKSDSPFMEEKFPVNIYTHPEMAHVGLTEPQVRELDTEYKINEFPLTANGKALTEGETDGLVRMLSDKKYGEVLGVQIVAAHATDMIAEAAAIMQLEGTVYDVAHTIHAHPTVSEIFMEAGFDASGQPVHK